MSGLMLFDEHRLSSEALAHQLQSHPEFTPVWSVCDPQLALAQFVEHSPDLVLMEVELSQADAPGLIRRMRELDHTCRIALLTGNDCDDLIQRALDAGIDGCILKQEGTDVLADAIARLKRGERFFSASIQCRLRHNSGRWELAEPRSRHIARLSRRERQLLGYLASGQSLKEAAARMHVSYKTADNQKASLMRKLGIHDRVQLALFAVREKLISPFCFDEPARPAPAAVSKPVPVGRQPALALV